MADPLVEIKGTDSLSTMVSKMNKAISVLNNIGSGVVFSPTRPTGDWSLWLQDLGEVDDLFEDGETLELMTAPISSIGEFAIEDETGMGETVTNMTDNPQSAGQNDIVLAE